MKKVLLSILFLCMVVLLAGCSSKKVIEEKIKGNCKATECITKIGVKDTLDEVNEIIGFDGTLKKEEDNYKTYKWDVSKSSSVEVTFYDNGKDDISIKFNKETVKDENVNFANIDEIKELVNTGKMSYETFVEKAGGVEGTLIQKSFYTKKYLWYNSSSKYLIGEFSEITGMCTLVTGYNE